MNDITNDKFMIEPGIYVPDSSKFPEQYRGIGIRIEDDILIGKNEPVVLSRQAPKEIDEIEQLLSKENYTTSMH
jgi:intermediate cleaving peptidase 55